jgi:hypothetical protein
METNYPTPELVRNATKETAPEGWIISAEYPDFIGVNHPSFTNEQFIFMGDVNGHFGFNDQPADIVCGDMENLFDPKEIAASFWKQLAAFYPELLKGENDMSQNAISWAELAELTHTTQVERFNFCLCEDNEGKENPYNDCPKGE